MSKNKLAIVGIFFALIIVVLLAFTAFKPEPNLILQIAPTKAKIVINGKEIKGDKVNLAPGGYKLAASFEGFRTETQNFTIKEGETTELIVLLNPNSEIGKQYLRDNPDEQFKRESLGGIISKKLSSELTEKNPILESLPFVDRLFRVDYGASEDTSDPTAIAIYVTYYSELGKQEADEWLKFKGVDLTQEELLYIDRSTTP